MITGIEVDNKLYDVSLKLRGGKPEPKPEPEPKPVDNTPIILSGHRARYSFKPKQCRFFKFEMHKTVTCRQGWQISNTSDSRQPRTVHVLIKRGSRPTVTDYQRTKEMKIAPSYDYGMKRWLPSKRNATDLYWKYNTGSQAEFVESNEPMDVTVYYIMLYNDGDKSVSHQRLTLKKW